MTESERRTEEERRGTGSGDFEESEESEELQRAKAHAVGGAATLASGAIPSPDAGKDAPVQLDAAFYDEVRRAVGRGTPTLLLGTSTRSLKRNLEKLMMAAERESELEVRSPRSRKGGLNVSSGF